LKTLLASFFYPGVEKYLDEFNKSVLNQTDNRFDVLIVNDGIDEELIMDTWDVVNNSQFQSIPRLRKIAIDYAIENEYDLLLFLDADDTMSNKRIEISKKSYSMKYAFYYNDLYVLDKDFYMGQLPSLIKNVESITSYNFIGMSHSGLNISITKDILYKMPINDKIIAFDWYLYSYLLLNGYEGIKIDTTTYYRLHENNIAGETKLLDIGKLKRGIQVKKYHYFSLLEYKKVYKTLYKKALELEEKTLNLEYCKRYINQNNKVNTHTIYWWENIVL